MRVAFSICILPALLLAFAVAALRASSIAPTTTANWATQAAALFDSTKQNAPYVTALTKDLQDCIWIGTEDSGVWRYDPATEQWTNFTTKDGLGDNNGYAIACDKLGRVWVGTRNHGVSIFNGKSWETIGDKSGLLGCRVFAIATCPTNGDVWIATEAGLTRYSLKSDTWTYRTQLDGLPSNQASCLAFDKLGNLLVGTQCDGISIGLASSDYHRWRLVPGPTRVANLPHEPTGSGLPSCLINCLLVSRKGVIYAGTDCGLAASSDNGSSWHYLRGADWANKVRGLVNYQWLDAVVQNGRTLQEDYVCSLAEDESGAIWVGHRLTGLEMVTAFTGVPLSYGHGYQTSVISGETVVSKKSQDASPPAGGVAIANGIYKVVNVLSGLALDVSRNDSTEVDLNTYNGARQQWAIRSVGGGYYEILCKANDLALTGELSSSPLVLRPYSEASNQLWSFTSSGSSFVLTNKASQQIIDDYNKSTQPGNPVGLWSSNGGQNQEWQILEVSDESAFPPVVTRALKSKMALPGDRPLHNTHFTSRASGKSIPSNDILMEYMRPLSTTDWAAVDVSMTPIRAILPDGDRVYVGTYGGGVTADLIGHNSRSKEDKYTNNSTVVSNLPAPAKAASLSRMIEMLRVLDQVPPDTKDTAGSVVALNDDWQTEGTWLGRYGRYWACLCGMNDPADFVWGAGPQKVSYRATMGPVHDPRDVVQCWTSWRFGNDPRSLEIPPLQLHKEVAAHHTTWTNDRRQTEWDDHGEAYPLTMDGPHLFCSLTVPPGLFYLSLYEFNKDAHTGPWNCVRDYRVSIREHTATNLLDVRDFDQEPELAHARVFDFWGGVWKRFLVSGPITLTIKIDRNSSLNANLHGIALDLVDQDPPLYYHTPQEWSTIETVQENNRARLISNWRSQRHEDTLYPPSSQEQAVSRIMDRLDQLRLTNPAWWAVNGPRFYTALIPWYEHAVKAVLADKERNDAYRQLGTCFYETCQFSDWENCLQAAGALPTRQIELALRKIDPARLAGNGKPVQLQPLRINRMSHL